MKTTSTPYPEAQLPPFRINLAFHQLLETFLCREPTRDGKLSALLARLPFQADGAALPAALGGPAVGPAEKAGGQQWMRELGEQLAAAQEELNIMLDVIHQVGGWRPGWPSWSPFSGGGSAVTSETG